MTDDLSIWTVYDHPSDDPTMFTARRFEVSSRGAVRTESTLRAHDLDDIRGRLLEMGLTRLERSPADDPVIVEAWL